MYITSYFVSTKKDAEEDKKQLFKRVENWNSGVKEFKVLRLETSM